MRTPIVVFASLAVTACTALRPPAPATTPAAPTAPALDRAAVRAALAARRDVTVRRFLAYREARVYPKNDFIDGPAHIWRDRAGHLCAAATMISGDWGREATARVADENTFLRLADVHDGPLFDWVLTSGLTHHEVVAIQGAANFEPLEVERTQETRRLYVLYMDVERQLVQLRDESLDEATDALMQHPALAQKVLAGSSAGPGKYAWPIVRPAPARASLAYVPLPAR